MRISCEHGFFRVFEGSPGELSELISLYGFSFVPFEGHFTFKELTTAPRFSIEGMDYMGQEAKVTYEGPQEKIFEKNGLAFNFRSGSVVNIESITQRVNIVRAGQYFWSNGLILPGSLTDRGQRIRSYSAWYSWEQSTFRYSEVSFV